MIDVPPRTRDATEAADWNVDAERRPIWEHYLRKCYLCEGPVALSEFQIDHRIPQHECGTFRHCRFNWFPACASCNGRRGNFPKDGGLLSPGLDRCIESRIEQRLERVSSTEVRARFTASDPEDRYARNTAAELERIHSPESGTTEPARGKAMELLDRIVDHYRENVYPLEMKVRRARRRGYPDARAELQLCQILARTEPFTMLVHSRVHSELRDLLERALDTNRS